MTRSRINKKKIVYVILAIMLVLLTWYSLKEKGITATSSDSDLAAGAELTESATASVTMSNSQESENSETAKQTNSVNNEANTENIVSNDTKNSDTGNTVNSSKSVSATAVNEEDDDSESNILLTATSVTDSSPSTKSQAVNIYMYIDGEWTFVGTTSSSRSGNNYRITQSNILTVINNTLELGLTSLNNYTTYYNTSTSSTTVNKLNSSGTNYTVNTSNYINIYITNTSESGSNIKLSDIESSNTLKVTSFTITEYDTDGTTIISSETVYTLNSSYSYTLSEDYNYYVNGSEEITYGGSTVTFTSQDNTLVRAPLKTYTLTIIYANGTTETVEVKEGGTYTLDDTMQWKVGDSEELVDGGTVITITEDTTVTESSEITIIYTVDTSKSATGQSLESEVVPYITANNESTYTITVSYNNGTTTETLTSDYVVTVAYNTYRYVSQFTGWSVDGDSSTVVNDDVDLTWDELYAIAVNGTVNLTTIWTKISNYLNYVNFYLQIYSVALDAGGSATGQASELFTGSLWASYVGNPSSTYDGTNKPPITDSTADNSYTADQTIRALEGEKENLIYIYDVPDDEYIFNQLREYISSDNTLSVDGITVSEDELDSDHFEIRWYVFKSQNDGWHVDGKLVRKEGKVTITKTFTGSKNAIESVTGYSFNNETQGSSDYYVTVASSDTTKNLSLSDADYITNSTTTVDGSTTYSLTYTWVVDVKYDVNYSVTESEYEVTDYKVTAEYNIVDPEQTEYEKVYNSDGTYYYKTDTDGNFVASYENQSTHKNQTLGTATFTGVNNYALDNTSAFDYTQILTVNLSNNYIPTTALTIKKVDSLTNNGLKNAKFSIYKLNDNGEIEGDALTFTYNESIYSYDENGTTTILTSPTGGEIVIAGLEYGNYVIKETTTPSGYESSVELTLNVDSDGIIIPVISQGTGSQYDENEKYIEVDNASKLTTVSVTKTWDSSVSEDYQKNVVVQLYLNGALISNYDFDYDIDGDGDIDEDDTIDDTVTLTSSSNWKYTWENLPLYIDGEEAFYTVKEIKIGDTSAATTGSFDDDGNWYSDDAYTQYTATTSTTKTVENDEVTEVSINLENSMHPIKININKVTSLGNALENVTFKLQKYDDSEELVDVAEGVTDENGNLSFGDLEYGVKYVLTETQGVDGYYIMDSPVYIIISKQGNSTDILTIYTDSTYETEASSTDYESGGYYEYVSLNDSQDTVVIINVSHTILPKSGGIGKYGFYILGIIIMTMCLGIRIYQSKKDLKI